jgi:two-component system response regulator MprA
VIVLDIVLPDADGRDVCRALRLRGVAAPVLFVSADPTTRASALAAGGDDHLTKPFALAELVLHVGGLARG